MIHNSRKYQQFVIQVGILVIFFLIPLWLRLPNAPKSFTRGYVLGFAWLIPLAFTLVIWGMSGFMGFRKIAKKGRQTFFAFAILGLALWSACSVLWAYMRDTRPDMTWGVVGQVALMALFAVMVLSIAPHPRWIALALILGMLAQGFIGAWQVTIQDDIGLRFLGEFRLDPAKGGISVVQAGDVRWLRPYGLTPHPNPYAGYVMVGVLCVLGWVMAWAMKSTPIQTIKLGRRGLPWQAPTGQAPIMPTIHPIGRRDRIYHVRMGLWGGLLLVILLFGFYILLLTFSRGAWLGFAIAGAGMLFILTARRMWSWRSFRIGLAVLGMLIITSGIFLLLYHPFILARAGVSDEYVERRAVNERAIHLTIAYAAFEDAPVWGVGIGNFPWYATYYLRYEMRVDMKGDNIHNVYLSALAELGIIGLVLMLGGLGTALTVFPKDLYRLGLWGGVMALAVVGLFDHYTWSMLTYSALWWGLMGAVLSQEG